MLKSCGIQVHLYVHTNVSMCVCLYVCMFACVCLYVFVCMCVCACLYVCMCMFVCVYVHVCMCVCACLYVCMCAYICMCLYVCMFAHARIIHACTYVQLHAATPIDHTPNALILTSSILLFTFGTTGADSYMQGHTKSQLSNHHFILTSLKRPPL